MKAVLTLTSVLLALWAANASAVSFPTASVTDGVGVSAMSIHYSDAELGLLKSAGVSILRVGVQWNLVESDPNHLGTYDWSEYDTLVSRCAAHNIKVYGLLCYGNDLYGDSSQSAYYGSTAFRNGFTNFASSAVNRYSQGQYSGKVTTWELWNEPNDMSTEGGFWPGAGVDPVTAANQYMALALGASGDAHPEGALRAIRNADPTAAIVAPGLSWPNWEPNLSAANSYLDRCFSYTSQYGSHGLLDSVGGVPLIDTVSVHPYQNGSTKPESVVTASNASTYASLQNKINSYNPSSTAKIVSGEWGYQSADVGLETQANYVQRMMLVNFSQRVPMSIWFTDFDTSARLDQTFGLIDIDVTPKPAYYAMQELTRSLRGETFKTKLYDSHSDVWLLEFTGSGQDTLVAWTTRDYARSHYTLPGNWGTYDLTGSPLFIHPSTVPEPGTLVLLLAGLIGLPVYFWIRSRRAWTKRS